MHSMNQLTGVIVTWVIKCTLLDFTSVPSMKSVDEIASDIGLTSCLAFYPSWGNLTCDLEGPGQVFKIWVKKTTTMGHISSAISSTDFIISTKVQPMISSNIGKN